jgi:hypothetical protein
MFSGEFDNLNSNYFGNVVGFVNCRDLNVTLAGECSIFENSACNRRTALKKQPLSEIKVESNFAGTTHLYKECQ